MLCIELVAVHVVSVSPVKTSRSAQRNARRSTMSFAWLPSPTTLQDLATIHLSLLHCIRQGLGAFLTQAVVTQEDLCDGAVDLQGLGQGLGAFIPDDVAGQGDVYDGAVDLQGLSQGLGTFITDFVPPKLDVCDGAVDLQGLGQGLGAFITDIIRTQVDVFDGAVDLQGLSQGLAKAETKSMDVV
eukprot:s2236_g9.t1